ncbi:hypothetical protein HLH33_19075 [Gluconacetobacter diazotrophicus]|uniref:Uncharacterized protein n=1 Tax=Gluconacetobacter diazotrophicus TaxID=33996 RepID=A0A7W4NIJ0_GLUDI|nr:hypothetical protein [Gluconacetobacter diazotrophicus]MBB2158366.1 hypothetical protein [Gluconacetobacter diazotrophicus]
MTDNPTTTNPSRHNSLAVASDETPFLLDPIEKAGHTVIYGPTRRGMSLPLWTAVRDLVADRRINEGGDNA